MTALSDSEVYFSVGWEFEPPWTDRIASANPADAVVDLTQGLELLPAIAHDDDGVVNQDEEDADHADEMDPHIWTSPAMVLPWRDRQFTDTLDRNLDRSTRSRQSGDISGRYCATAIGKTLLLKTWIHASSWSSIRLGLFRAGMAAAD